jgi:hypothetical protein
VRTCTWTNVALYGLCAYSNSAGAGAQSAISLARAPRTAVQQVAATFCSDTSVAQRSKPYEAVSQHVPWSRLKQGTPSYEIAANTREKPSAI